MGILDSRDIITGIKSKTKPTNRGFQFQKDQPLGPYNYPLTKYTHWKAYGYKIDTAGIRRPHWIEKTLPTGKPFIPDLDEVISVHPVQQGIIPPREEKNKKYSKID